MPITDFRRGVVRDLPNDNEYKKFTDFVETDNDIGGINWSSFQSSGKLIVYVMSYGYDVSVFDELYSEPVLLGTISLDFVLP